MQVGLPKLLYGVKFSFFDDNRTQEFEKFKFNFSMSLPIQMANPGSLVTVGLKSTTRLLHRYRIIVLMDLENLTLSGLTL